MSSASASSSSSASARDTSHLAKLSLPNIYLNHFFVQKSVYALIKVSFKRHVLLLAVFRFSLWNAFDANTDNFVCLVMTRIIPEFTTLYTTETLFPLFIIINNYTFSQIGNILRYCSVQCEGWVFLQI